MEINIGKCRLIYDGPDKENMMKDLLISSGKVEMPDYYDSLEEFFDEEFYGEYLIMGDKIYSIESTFNSNNGNIIFASPNTDGSIDFVLYYYNGGCSMREALEKAIRNMNDKNTRG